MGQGSQGSEPRRTVGPAGLTRLWPARIRICSVSRMGVPGSSLPFHPAQDACKKDTDTREIILK